MAFYDSTIGKTGKPVGSQGVDLRQRSMRKGVFAPVETTASFLRSPEWQEYANPGQNALNDAIEALFGGGQTAKRQALQNVGRLGLGRGAATQLQSDIDRGTASGVAEATVGSRLLGTERRMQGGQMLMDAIRASQQAAALRRMMHRQSSSTSLIQGGFASAGGQGFANLLTGATIGGALQGVTGLMGAV